MYRFGSPALVLVLTEISAHNFCPGALWIWSPLFYLQFGNSNLPCDLPFTIDPRKVENLSAGWAFFWFSLGLGGDWSSLLSLFLYSCFHYFYDKIPETKPFEGARIFPLTGQGVCSLLWGGHNGGRTSRYLPHCILSLRVTSVGIQLTFSFSCG